jgi:PEP-CTERM motif
VRIAFKRRDSAGAKEELMSRFAIVGALAISGALLGPVPSALAICPVPTASFTGGSFGTDAVTGMACLLNLQQNGGTGITSAGTSFSDPASGTSLSASADLATGVLTAYAAGGAVLPSGGFASASEWDTFTFSGLPADGSMITATLSLTGTITGGGSVEADLQEAGPAATIQGQGALDSSGFFNATTYPLPGSISLAFMATDGTSDTVYADIQADGNGPTEVDLTDPPTLDLTIPIGVTVSSASGVFTDFRLQAVPEPSSLGLFAAALGLFGYIGRRRARRMAR